MFEEKPRISIMTWSDQFDIATSILGFLEHIGKDLTEEEEEELFEGVMALTDEFSIGLNTIVEDYT